MLFAAITFLLFAASATICAMPDKKNQRRTTPLAIELVEHKKNCDTLPSHELPSNRVEQQQCCADNQNSHTISLHLTAHDTLIKLGIKNITKKISLLVCNNTYARRVELDIHMHSSMQIHITLARKMLDVEKMVVCCYVLQKKSPVQAHA
jgi:hypothetical protein